MIWRGENDREDPSITYYRDPEFDGGGGGGGGNGGSETEWEYIASQLRDRLEEDEWASGEALPSNKELAEEYATSRSSVARAMRSLAEEGLVEIIPRRGTFKK